LHRDLAIQGIEGVFSDARLQVVNSNVESCARVPRSSSACGTMPVDEMRFGMNGNSKRPLLLEGTVVGKLETMHENELYRNLGSLRSCLSLSITCCLVARGFSRMEPHPPGCLLSRGAPFGDDGWQAKTAVALALESALRRPGRPKKDRQNLT
jgi:hypothetical protein